MVVGGGGTGQTFFPSLFPKLKRDGRRCNGNGMPEEATSGKEEGMKVG